jgi:hypothetical protein
MIASEPFLRDLWDRIERGEIQGKGELQRAKAELVGPRPDPGCVR